jgi:hypothetical protein
MWKDMKANYKKNPTPMSQVLNAMAKLNKMNSRIKKPYSWA